jgi:hypothetical protein
MTIAARPVPREANETENERRLAYCEQLLRFGEVLKGEEAALDARLTEEHARRRRWLVRDIGTQLGLMASGFAMIQSYGAHHHAWGWFFLGLLFVVFVVSRYVTVRVHQASDRCSRLESRKHEALRLRQLILRDVFDKKVTVPNVIR